MEKEGDFVFANRSLSEKKVQKFEFLNFSVSFKAKYILNIMILWIGSKSYHVVAKDAPCGLNFL